MKNKIIFLSLICLAILFSWAGVSWAGTTSSVAVSFSIPVIPGLNAPLIEQTQPATPQAATKQAAPQQETIASNQAPVQTKQQEEKITIQTQDSQAMVKTIYSR